MDYRLIFPEVFLFLWSLLLLFLNLKAEDRNHRLIGFGAMAGLVVALALTLTTGDGEFSGKAFISDAYARCFKTVFVLSALLTIAVSIDFAAARLAHRGEFYCLLLLSTVGMMFLASAGELISLYVALELSTIPLYALAAFMKTDPKSSEAGLKYLILGAASSGILLFGLSLLYGLTGSTIIDETSYRLFYGSGTALATVFAIVMFVAGFGFKLAAAPFHMWAPDVYEGAPTPVTAFLSVASKAAGLVALVRIFFNSFLIARAEWVVIIEVMSVLAMVIGNVIALLQKNIKRMLAYSSIAQVGYVLVAIAAGIDLSIGSMLIFLLAYLFANIGAFIVVIGMTHGGATDMIEEYAGLWRRAPSMAIMMTIYMLSLVGIPATGGFIAKYFLFGAAVKEGLYAIVIVGILTSVISLFYYMNVVKVMLFHPPKTTNIINLPPLVRIGLAISTTMVIIIGIAPSPFYQWAMNAAKVFRL